MYINFEDITGFSEEVLQNQALMRHYSPITVVNQDFATRHTISVLSGEHTSDDIFVATVEEEWIIQVRNSITGFNHTHQVKLQYIDGKWIIIYNRIV